MKHNDFDAVFFNQTSQENYQHTYYSQFLEMHMMKMLHKLYLPLCISLAMTASLLAFEPLPSIAQDIPQGTSAQGGLRRSSGSSSAESLGVRYLKLGNSYREARNYDLSQYYLKKGIDLIRNRSYGYWEAVGYEYLGLLYRDMGDRQMALEYLRTAASLYDRVVNMNNGQGSDEVLRAVIADVEQGTNAPVTSPMLTSTPLPDTRLQDENGRLQNENKTLQAKITELEGRIKQLEASSVMSLKSTASLDMSDCKRDMEGIAKYRESTLWMNGFAPVDFTTRDVRLAGGNARVDGTVIIGYLKRGESAKIELTMPIGQYLILGDGCSQKARDLDVRIINQQGVVLEKKDIRFNPNDASAGSQTKSDSMQSSSQTQGTQSNNQSSNQVNNQANTQSNTQAADSITTQQSTESLPRKPANTREALAKVGWSNEYGGSHTFLVTMYECDNEGAYFCFLIGKK
jgi:tetratricopeptide (TPR) repeat protein